MKRLLIIVLAAAVFIAVLIARLPAAWVLPAFGHGLACSSVHGSVWDGECIDAHIQDIAVDQLLWQVHPHALLRGRLSVTVSVLRGNDTASGELSLGWRGTLHGRDLHARFRLDPALVPIIPSYITGRVAADIAHITLKRNGTVTRLRGRITVRNLIDSSGQVTPLGSFVANFPGGPREPLGRLRDLGGPLALTGTLRLTAQPGYVLHANLATRADAAPSLVQALEYLGAPDAEGRRPFALAGTY